VLKKSSGSEELSRFAAASAGGSLQAAQYIIDNESDSGLADDLSDCCSAISGSLTSDTGYNFDVTGLIKKHNSFSVVNSIINLYLFNLHSIINGNIIPNSYFEKFFITDKNKLKRIIKILLAIKNVEKQNVNMDYAFRSAVYEVQNPEKLQYLT